MQFSIKNFFINCDLIRRRLRIWSHLLKKSLMENLLFCAGLSFSIISLFQLNTEKSVRQYFAFLPKESRFLVHFSQRKNAQKMTEYALTFTK